MDPTPKSRARWLKERAQLERGLAEILGIVRGVVADGVVSTEEADHLARWTGENPDVAARWPVNLLHRRLEQIFQDGRVDAKERHHLSTVLGQLAENPSGLNLPLATDVPVDRPQPEVLFEGRTFVFGGEMAYGPLKACEREVQELGGSTERSVSRRTSYLVIGSLGATDWSQDSFGSLLDEVVQYRGRGVPIAVVSEERWAEALP